MTWLEDDTDDESVGPLVRPYAMTHGRTRTSTDFDLITLVVAARPPGEEEIWEPEHLSILELAQQPVAVAEIAARMNIPTGVARVMLDDLSARGALIMRTTYTDTSTPKLQILKAVADGLRAL
jgi:hypothetical protein